MANVAPGSVVARESADISCLLSRRRRSRRRSTSSSPRLARRNGRSGVRCRGRVPRRGGWASCRSSRCGRTTGTSADASICRRSRDSPRTRGSPVAARSARCCPGVCRHRSSREYLHQRRRVVVASVDGTVDEQGGRPLHLTRGDPALDITAYALQAGGAGPVAVELSRVEVELGGVAAQVVVLELTLAMEQELVHLPDPALAGRRLRRRSRRERVRMDLGQGKVSEGEANTAVQPPLDPFDLAERLARVWTLVVAVLEDHGAPRRAADVIDGFLERLHHPAAGFSSTIATPWPEPTQTPATPYLAPRSSRSSGRMGDRAPP